MTLPKGGRGKKAPYDTRTVRIPVAVLAEVEAIAEQYRLSVLEGGEFKAGGNPTLDEAIAIAKEVLKQKRSAKQSVRKLLQVLYNAKVTDKMLD